MRLTTIGLSRIFARAFEAKATYYPIYAKLFPKRGFIVYIGYFIAEENWLALKDISAMERQQGNFLAMNRNRLPYRWELLNL